MNGLYGFSAPPGHDIIPSSIRLAIEREDDGGMLIRVTYDVEPSRRGLKVHAVWPGNTKETVCEHEFTMFDKAVETWTPVHGGRVITCKTCRDILHLPPL